MQCAEFGFGKAPHHPNGVRESTHKRYLLLPKSVSDRLRQKQCRRWRSGDWPLSRTPTFLTHLQERVGVKEVGCAATKR